MEAEYFSDSSVNCYLHSVRQLCLYKKSLPDTLAESDIYDYLAYLKTERKLSRETIRNHLQGIRFMYKSIFKRIDIIRDIPYPKHSKKLPIILNGKEIKALFDPALTLKHQMVLKVAYSGGLRRSGICRLKLVDIDSKNNLLRIEDSRGNKDRYTLLAPSLVPGLREYCKKYKPKKYLFNGRVKGFPYSEEGIRLTFNRALEKSGIQKKVSLHSLRHSFASHLLATGVDLFTIQKLMGHDDIRTTMVYLQINHRLNPKKPISPLEFLLR